jgi:hypothetical protein
MSMKRTSSKRPGAAAGDAAFLGFTGPGLVEQAEAISTVCRSIPRVAVS